MALKDVGVRVVVQGTDKFKRQMSGVNKTVTGLKNTIVKHNRAIGLGMIGLGAGIAAVGIMSVKTYARMGDEVQKMAFKTGFSTEKLSELRHAAELSGASLKSIEKGVKTMSSALVDAQSGLETYARSFRQLGLDVDEVMQLHPEDQFMVVAEALADVENQTLKSALAQDIFGRAGLELLPLLAQGSDGLREMAQEAHDLGIVFDQEAANAAALFNDNMTRLGKSFDGVKFAIANTLIPILTPLIEKITTVVKSIIDWTRAHPDLTRAIVIATGVMGGLSFVLGGMLLILPTISALLLGLGISAGIAMIAVAGLTAGIGLLVFGIMGLINNAKAREAIAKIEEERTKALAGETNKLAEAYENAITRGYIRATPEMLTYIANTKAIAAASRDAAAATREQTNAIFALIGARRKERRGEITEVFGGISAALQRVPEDQREALEEGLRRQAFGPGGILHVPPAGGGTVNNITYNIEATYTNPQDPATIALDMEALALEAAR